MQDDALANVHLRKTLHHELRDSTVIGKRGWTYQEGILSHRRIFFTDEQVMFQCNTMACVESFDIPRKPKTRTYHHLKDAEPLNLATKYVAEHIMEFSKRNLTNDDDTLPAFSGVLNYFHKTKHCFHLEGNPIPSEKGKGHLINAWYHTEPATRNITRRMNLLEQTSNNNTHHRNARTIA